MDSNDSFSLSALEAGEGNFPHPGPHPPIHPQMAPYPGENFDPAGLPPAGPHPVFPPQCGVDEGGDYEPPSPDSWVGESGAYPP